MEANGPYFIVKGAEGKCDRAEAKQEVRKNIAAEAIWKVRRLWIDPQYGGLVWPADEHSVPY